MASVRSPTFPNRVLILAHSVEQKHHHLPLSSYEIFATTTVRSHFFSLLRISGDAAREGSNFHLPTRFVLVYYSGVRFITTPRS